MFNLLNLSRIKPGDFYKPRTDFMDDLGGLVKEGEDKPKYKGLFISTTTQKNPSKEPIAVETLPFTD